MNLVICESFMFSKFLEGEIFGCNRVFLDSQISFENFVLKLIFAEVWFLELMVSPIYGMPLHVQMMF